MRQDTRQRPVRVGIGGTVFGPLPRLHRIFFVAVTIVLGISAGAWLAQTTLPLVVPLGALAGGLSGIALAWLLMHRFAAHPHPARARHRR